MTRPTSSQFLGGIVNTLELLERSMSSDEKDWPVFSYSQFQAWDRCEMLWDYAYARNWYKIRNQLGLNLGSELHLGWKFWYDMAVERVPKPARLERMKSYWVERVNLFAEEQVMLPVVYRSMWLLTRYFQEFAPVADKGHKILAAEHHFTVPFKTKKGRNFILQGYIDLLSQLEQTLWAWDHKSMSGQFWTPTMVQMEPQTPTYCAALREQGMRIHGVIINMVNTYDYKKPSEVATEKIFRREKAYRTDKELDSVVYEMKLIADDIIDNHENRRRSLRPDCQNCSFQNPCLMKMKGIDDEPFLQSDYIQKEKHNVELKLEPERLDNIA